MVVKHSPKSKQTLTYKVAKLENIVKADKPERKFFDVPLGTTISLTGGTMASSITSLCTIAQGTNIGQRVGNEIKLLSINYKGVYDIGNQKLKGIRAFLIEDKQQISDTAPAVSDIFSDIHPNNYLLSLANLKRFRILGKSKIHYNSGDNIVFDSMEYPEMNIFHQFKYPLKVRFNGTASTDGQKNIVYLVIIYYPDSGAPTTYATQQVCRVKYTDN